MTGMLALAVLVGMGEKMAERFLPLYLIAMGGTVWSGGFLADRIGYKRSLQLFTLIAMFGYLLVLLVPAWQAVLIGSVFFISWTAVTLPAVMSMVSQVVPKSKRTLGVSLHSFVRRIPMALGPVVGGLLIGAFGRVRGVKMAFGAALVMAVIALYGKDVGPAEAGR